MQVFKNKISEYAILESEDISWVGNEKVIYRKFEAIK